ncbi:hypothetical protein D3C87_1538380 [compost metagenome]
MRLSGKGIGQSDNDHAEMHERNMGRQDRGLMATMLGPGRGEDRANLAHQGIARPQTARLV